MIEWGAGRGYHERLMRKPWPKVTAVSPRVRPADVFSYLTRSTILKTALAMRGAVVTAALLLAALVFASSSSLPAQQTTEIIKLEEIKPGMKGVAYTIFAGDTIEAFELEVIGVLPNLLGPRQSIVLVQLKGAKVEHTGVVAGMSGSPVYIEGKLAGALSLKFGVFTKEPLAGVTPIESVMEAGGASAGAREEKTNTEATQAQRLQRTEEEGGVAGPVAVPANVAERMGLAGGAYLEPIETPVVFAGFHRAAVERFARELAPYGMVAAQGGTAEAKSDDKEVRPGDMVSMVLVKGDLSIQASCTVTRRVGDTIYVCGHPIFGFGPVEMPLARGRVLTTLSSDLNSVKIVNAGGVIGTVTQDRLTAVTGKLGAAPRMIPVELTFVTLAGEKTYRFELIDHSKLTPLLMANTVFNGVVSTPAYREGTTLRLTGGIEIEGHTRANLENLFAPTDQFIPDGAFLAVTVQQTFARIYSNPYERAKIEKIALRVESIPERRAATIESVWADRNEVLPGETVNVKVLLRPWRGPAMVKELAITVPPQAPRNTTLRLMVSDGPTLNRLAQLQTFGAAGRLGSLEQLIGLINRERRNSRIYVTLLVPNPTLLVEDKELPNAPLSEINLLDQRRGTTGSLVLRESTAGEWSEAMEMVISGQQSVTIRVR